MSRVFFYVQHLLGIGHLRRAAVLARALVAGGFDVLLVSTGAPPETSSTSKPPAAKARASTAARRRWPMPSRCCT